MIKRKLYLNTILQKHACRVTKCVAIFGFFFENLSKTRVKNWVATIAIQFSTPFLKYF